MYIYRNIEDKIWKHINRKEYTIIVGARQTGKTTLLHRLFTKHKEQNQRVFYLSFENLDILQSIDEHPENIFRYAIRPKEPHSKDESNAPVVIFIDEIQYAANPSNFLKYLYDKYLANLKIVATGSSAFYIDHAFNDSLAGRKRLFILRSLSFDEYLRFKKLNALHDELVLIRQQSDYISSLFREMLEVFNEYLVFGGYPAVALEKEKEEKILLLKDLKNSFLKKDIDESGISNRDAFLKLFMILAEQVGNLLNKNELSNTIGVDNKTIDSYLNVLMKSFHIELIKPFSTNLRKELIKMPKVFLLDNGMRNAMLNRFSDFDHRADRGALLENYVFARLAEVFEVENMRFWRTTDKKEVDFVVSADFKIGQAFEVKIGASLKKSSGLYKFRELYPNITTNLLTYEFSDNSLQVLKM